MQSQEATVIGNNYRQWQLVIELGNLWCTFAVHAPRLLGSRSGSRWVLSEPMGVEATLLVSNLFHTYHSSHGNVGRASDQEVSDNRDEQV